MSSQEQFNASNDDVLHAVAAAYPACPRCRRRMVVKQVLPVLFADDIDDFLYGCEGCGAEVKRSVTRR